MRQALTVLAVLVSLTVTGAALGQLPRIDPNLPGGVTLNRDALQSALRTGSNELRRLAAIPCIEAQNDPQLPNFRFGRDDGSEYIVKLATGESSDERHTGAFVLDNGTLVQIRFDAAHTSHETFALRMIGCDGEGAANYSVALRSLGAGNGQFVRSHCSAERWLCSADDMTRNQFKRFELIFHDGLDDVTLRDHEGNDVTYYETEDPLQLFFLRTGDGPTVHFRLIPSPWQEDFDRPWGDIIKAIGETPLLTVMMDWPNLRAGFHDACIVAGPGPHYDVAYLDRMLFGPRPSFNDWLIENSYGRFRYTNARILDWSMADRNFADGNIVAGMIQKVREIDAEIDFAEFDANGDGRVDRTELAVIFYLAHDNCFVRRGAFWRPLEGLMTDDGVVLGDAEGAGGLRSAHMYVHLDITGWTHELIHMLGPLDMYLGRQSPDTGGAFTNLAASWTSVHLDAVHKIKLGWIPPRAAYRSGSYGLRPATEFPDALIVYNPQHGAREYFVLEYRPGTGYDAGIIGEAPAQIASSNIRGCADGGNQMIDERGGRPRCEFEASGIPEDAATGLVVWRLNEEAGGDPRRALHLMAASGDFAAPGEGIAMPHAVRVPGGQREIDDFNGPLRLFWADDGETGIRISDLRIVDGQLQMRITINPVE